MVTPRTGTHRGRRRKKYRDDSDRYALDRYAIAYARALQALGASESGAFKIAASLFYGEKAEPEKTRRRPPPGMARVAWAPRRIPGAVGLPTAADRLRLKSKRKLSEEDAEHQAILTEACKISIAAKDERTVIPLVLGMLTLIGERQFGEKCLAPMIRAKGEG
jgi:hypothetical protein